MDERFILRKKMYFKYFLSRNTNIYSEAKTAGQRIVIALAADYGNLGDVAISYASSQLMAELYPQAYIIDFPISSSFIHMKDLKAVLEPHDIIAIVGGGNMGDTYDDIEYCRQFIIQQFPNNPIISFPQTTVFTDSSYGQMALKKFSQIYNNHDNLTLSAREENSYKFLKQALEDQDIQLIPDVVLSLDLKVDNINRQGITLCLRQDKEKVNYKFDIASILKKEFPLYSVVYRDTHIDRNHLTLAEREAALKAIWKEFSQSDLVITDRLHGMIFSAITQTPCLALNNSNGKVAGIYNLWLKHLNYIQLYDESQSLESQIQSLLNLPSINPFNAEAYKALIKSSLFKEVRA